MTDDLEPIRQLRPDRNQPDDPPDIHVLTEERHRLMATISGAPTDTGDRVRTPSIYPRLAYDDEGAALEFLVRVFGLREIREARMEHPDGILAWLAAGDGMVMISRAGPDRHDLHSPRHQGTTAMVNVYVDDIEAHYRRSVAEGAGIAMGLEDMFWGDRRYEAFDAEGHRWHFAQRLSPTREDATRARPSPPSGMPRILPHLIYDDVGAAVVMLTEVFGFQEREWARHTYPDGTVGRTQMQVGDSVITLGLPSVHGDSPSRGVSSMLYIYVDDVEGHYQRAVAAGARIVTELETMPWGDRRYQARDREGHQWTFAQPALG